MNRHLIERKDYPTAPWRPVAPPIRHPGAAVAILHELRKHAEILPIDRRPLYRLRRLHAYPQQRRAARAMEPA